MGGFILDQLTFHPWSVGLAALILVVCFALVLSRPAADRPRALPAVVGLVLVAMAGGVAAGVYSTFLIFRSISLTGSGGEGAVAAGLVESRVVVLIWLAGAVLTAVAGLASTARAAETAGSTELDPEATRPLRRMLDAALTVAIAVALLVGYETWFVGWLPGIFAFSRQPAADAELVAGHFLRLRVFSFGALLVSLGLAIVLGAVAWRRATTWTLTKRWQTVLGALVFACLIAGAFAVWQCNVYYEAAIRGRF